MGGAESSISLRELQSRVVRLLSNASLRNVWVTAELTDYQIRGQHGYCLLIEKDPRTGVNVAQARGTLWASQRYGIETKFQQATGTRLASGIKVMLCVTVSYHEVYGLSLNIQDIDPTYTLGDLQRRRREILARLQREGILNQNREIALPEVMSRVAIISAPGAAGYSDFVHQLLQNRYRLRFKAKLFEAVMQGQQAPGSVLNALERIVNEGEQWDCVVIIRGGGSTADVASFEDYNLAAAVATFPIPVIVGIGHEVDVTLLDYVGHRVKTPTAAAQLLVSHGEAALARVNNLSQLIGRLCADRLASERTRLAYLESILPVVPRQLLEHEKMRLSQVMSRMAGLPSRLAVYGARLDNTQVMLSHKLNERMRREHDRLTAYDRMVRALAPDVTLRRGYSITRVDGKAVTDASTLTVGTVVETVYAQGSSMGTVTEINIEKE